MTGLRALSGRSDHECDVPIRTAKNAAIFNVTVHSINELGAITQIEVSASEHMA